MTLKNLNSAELQLVLDMPIRDRDSGAKTPRDYFKRLLTTLWREVEEFSGKRPFGNSGWDWDLGIALTKAGYSHDFQKLVTLDEDGLVEDVHPDYDAFVLALIKAM